MQEKNKKIYIISTIIVLIIFTVAIIFLLKGFSSNEDGTITLEFIDLDNELVDKKEISFSENETLYEICQKEYNNIVIDNNGYIQEIGPFKTEYNEDSMIYISLYIDDEYSTYLFNQIPFTDKTKITFKQDEYKYA